MHSLCARASHNALTGNTPAAYPRFYICQLSLEFMVDAISVRGSASIRNIAREATGFTINPLALTV